MSNAATRVAPKRFTTKAQWAKAKADELYDQAKELQSKPCMNEFEARRRRDSIAVLQREASRFMSISYRYEEKGL